MTETPQALTLIGFLILDVDQPGFVDPVFLDGDRRVIQRALTDPDVIAGFDEISVAFAVKPRSAGRPIACSAGGRRLYAFRFADGSIHCGDRAALAAVLTARLYEAFRDPALMANPLVLFDILSFLEYDQAIAREMVRETLVAAYSGPPADGEPIAHTAVRLFEHGFTFASASGRLHAPYEADLICVREPEVRTTLAAGLSRLKTGRLFPVFCLFTLAAAPLVGPRLAEIAPLVPVDGTERVQWIAGIAAVWFLFEAFLVARRLSNRRLVDGVVSRFRQLMARR